MVLVSALVLGGLYLGIAAVFTYELRDRRHQNCRWYLRWRRRPCYACICQTEREVFGTPDVAHLGAR